MAIMGQSSWVLEVKPGGEHGVFLQPQQRQREALVHMHSSQRLNK